MHDGAPVSVSGALLLGLHRVVMEPEGKSRERKRERERETHIL